MDASFSVARKISRAMAPHTSGEGLIKPAAVEVAIGMCGDAVAKKLAMVPSSKDTIKWRIQELLDDVLQQTIASVKRSRKLSLRLEETTGIGSDAQFKVFVRYLVTNHYVEQFLFCHSLIKNTTGEEIFKTVNMLCNKHQIEWYDCVPVCADGAPSKMGSKRGFVSFVKRQNNYISVVHCLLHIENLAAKETQEGLAIVFKEVVTVSITLGLVLCTLIFFVSSVTKWVQNTMSFCFIKTFVDYCEERC